MGSVSRGEVEKRRKGKPKVNFISELYVEVLDLPLVVTWDCNIGVKGHLGALFSSPPSPVAFVALKGGEEVEQRAFNLSKNLYQLSPSAAISLKYLS